MSCTMNGRTLTSGRTTYATTPGRIIRRDGSIGAPLTVDRVRYLLRGCYPAKPAQAKCGPPISEHTKRVIAAVEKTGSVREAAKVLGLGEKRVYNTLTRHGISAARKGAA